MIKRGMAGLALMFGVALAIIVGTWLLFLLIWNVVIP